ncbi:MAG: hypothetical protein ACKOEO_26795 [Planctomycetaceae bacterium]
MSDQKVYVYKIVVDNGGAPCVHDRLLSLAICKPAIRRTAQAGDLIFAFGTTIRQMFALAMSVNILSTRMRLSSSVLISAISVDLETRIGNTIAQTLPTLWRT